MPDEFSQPAPVTGENSANGVFIPHGNHVSPVSPTAPVVPADDLAETEIGTDQLPSSTVDAPVSPELAPVYAALDALAYQHGTIEAKVDHLHVKLDDQRQGLAAIYTMVDGLVKMLSVVQQVASSMPFGKKMSKAMESQMNGGNPNG